MTTTGMNLALADVQILDTSSRWYNRARWAIIVLGLVGLIASCFFPGQASAQQAAAKDWTGPKMRIVVMNLSGSALKMQTVTAPTFSSTTIALPPPAGFALGLTEMLTTALVNTGKFVVLERATVEQIKAEQDLGEAGRVHKETAAASGKITGAQMQITGDITEFSYQQSTVGGNLKIIKGLKAKSERVTAMVALDIRLIDAVTSEVVFSKRYKGTASMTGVSAEFVKEDKEFAASGSVNTPLGHASREAIEEAVETIVAGMKKVPWSGRVIDVRSEMVYINAGTDLGIRPGMEFDVYEQAEALVDPETGRSLGAPDRKVGSLAVQAVEDKYAVARGTAGSGFKRNNLVRFKGQAEKP